MKSKPRFKIDFGPKPEVTVKDVTYNPETNMVTITGETLERLERRAKEAGISAREYFNQKIRELIQRDQEEPGWLEGFLLEHAREEMIRRLQDLL